MEALEIGRAGPCLLKEISHNSGYSQGRMESRHLWVDVVHDSDGLVIQISHLLFSYLTRSH